MTYEAEWPLDPDTVDLCKALIHVRLASIPVQDIRKMAARASADLKDGLVSGPAGPSMRAQYLKPAQVASRISTNLPFASQMAVRLFFEPVLETARQVLTPTQFDKPNESEFRAAVEAIYREWHTATADVQMLLLTLANIPAKEYALAVATERIFSVERTRGDAPTTDVEPALIDDGEGGSRLAPIEIPDLEDDIYTPLSRVLMRTFLAAINRDSGSLDRQECEALLQEYIEINHAHFPAWWLAGFAAGLEVVPLDFYEDSPAHNAERTRWRLWGLLKAFERHDTEDTRMRARDYISAHQGEVSDMLANYLGSDLVPYLATLLIGSNNQLAMQLINSLPKDPRTPVNVEMAIASKIDDESVRLLRANDAAGAVSLLELARQRLDVIGTQRAHIGWPKSRTFCDLEARLAMGLAAAHRILNSFQAAESVLTSVKQDTLEAAHPRTKARFTIQSVLTAIHVTRIDDVKVPRGRDDRRATSAKLEPHELALRAALELNPDADDAHYLLGCLHLAREEGSRAMAELGTALVGYVTRTDRSYLEPQIRWAQLVQDVLLSDTGSLDQAVARLRESAPDTMHLRTVEADAIARRLLDDAPAVLTVFFSLYESEPQHAAPGVDILEEAVLAQTNISSGLLNAIDKVSPYEARFDILLVVLDSALMRADNDDIEAVLDHIDWVRSHDMSSIHLRWGKALYNSAPLRDYLGSTAADMAAAAEYVASGDRNELAQVLATVAESLWPVRTSEDYVRLMAILDDLQDVDPSEANRIQQDARSQVPDSWHGWAASDAAEGDVAEPVSILFVGGMPERQRVTLENVRRRLEDEFGASVSFEFQMPGWSSNWAQPLQEAEARFDSVDGLVLMHFVRTTFGRHIRKSAGEHNVPWVGCQGIGQDRILAAVRNCRQLVLQHRARATN